VVTNGYSDDSSDQVGALERQLAEESEARQRAEEQVRNLESQLAEESDARQRLEQRVRELEQQLASTPAPSAAPGGPGRGGMAAKPAGSPSLGVTKTPPPPPAAKKPALAPPVKRRQARAIYDYSAEQVTFSHFSFFFRFFVFRFCYFLFFMI
jgi:TolA-binding protein